MLVQRARTTIGQRWPNIGPTCWPIVGKTMVALRKANMLALRRADEPF